MGLFKKQASKRIEPMPEIEEESEEEDYPVEETEEVEEEPQEERIKKAVGRPPKKLEEKQEEKYLEVPIVLTDDKIKVMIWENNLMLKQLMELAKKD